MNTNPGWYPDPTGAPGQRYHDGQRWTDHFTPTPPPTAKRKPLIALAVLGGADREDRLYQQGDPRDVHGQYLPPEFPR